MNKIFVAVPTTGRICAATVKSFWGLDHCENYLVMDYVRGYGCAEARNRIGKQAFEENADYVLMVDDDVVLPGDALKNLLSDNRDVVFGYYAHRPDTSKTCLCKLGEYNYSQMYSFEEIENLANNGTNLIQIHGGGFGCVLIKTEVFSRLEYPWFKFVNYPDGRILSEDLFFCDRCENANIDLFADTRVRCLHVLEQEF